MKCPRCGGPSEITGKNWKYNVFQVKQRKCKTCHKYFNAFFMGNNFSHTIPKHKK